MMALKHGGANALLSIELEGKVYDGSLSGQLERLKQRIARGH